MLPEDLWTDSDDYDDEMIASTRPASSMVTLDAGPMRTVTFSPDLARDRAADWFA